MLGGETTYYERESMLHGFIPHVMGTRFDLLMIHLDRALLDKLWTAIADELARLEKMLNRFDPGSETSWINSSLRQGQTSVSKEMESVLRLCRSYYDRTCHLFDVTLKDFSQMQLHEDGRLSSADTSLTIDFGGFAKGYALRKIRELLHQEGIKDAFVDFGNSSILGLGHHPYGNCWKVSLLNPYSQAALDEYALTNQSLSTSGNTVHYSGHIVNPLTGIHDEQKKVTTIVADDPLDAEVLSTVWMIADDRQRTLIGIQFKNTQGRIYIL